MIFFDGTSIGLAVENISFLRKRDLFTEKAEKEFFIEYGLQGHETFLEMYSSEEHRDTVFQSCLELWKMFTNQIENHAHFMNEKMRNQVSIQEAMMRKGMEREEKEWE